MSVKLAILKDTFSIKQQGIIVNKKYTKNIPKKNARYLYKYI